MKSSGHYTGYRLIPLIAAIIIGGAGGSVQGAPQKGEMPEALRQRVTAYFQAWQRGDYEAVSNLIHEENRKYYIFKVNKFAIQSYTVGEAQCNPGGNLCDVASSIVRPLAIPGVPEGQTISMPLVMRWGIAPDGKWYLQMSTPENDPGLEPKRTPPQGMAVAPSGAVPPKATVAEKQDENRVRADSSNPVRFHRGEKPVFKFTYRNPLNRPIRLETVSADCYCVSAHWDYTLLGPGESGTLEAELNSFNLPLGSIRLEIKIGFSDLASPVIVGLELTNLPNFTIAPQSLDFGELKAGGAVEKAVEIQNESGRRVTILNLSKADHRIAVRLDKTVVDPGGKVRMTIRLNPSESGEIADIVTVSTDLAAEPLVNIAVHGRILS